MGVSASVNLTLHFPSTADIDQRIMRGENLAAERLLALSVAEAPLDTGMLIGSGAVENATSPEEGAVITFDTPYAVRLHEHPEFNFQNGRKGKYLEEPALQHKDEFGAIIAKEIADG